MENNDYLVKSMTKDGMFRAYAVRATNLVEKAHEIHDTWSASPYRHAAIINVQLG